MPPENDQDEKETWCGYCGKGFWRNSVWLILLIFGLTVAMTIFLGHFSIIIFVFVTAIVLGEAIPYQMIDATTTQTISGLGYGCNPNTLQRCVYNQLIYRAGMALTVLFLLLGFIAIYSTFLENRSILPVKYLFAIGLFIAFWWGSNTYFSGWSDACRVLSFLFLLILDIFILNFSVDCHRKCHSYIQHII